MKPSAYSLWVEADGDPGRYQELLREHKLILLPGDAGYATGVRDVICGWKTHDD